MAFWHCESCGRTYPCIQGIPKLYIESSLGQNDKLLRDNLYNSFLGIYYRYVMPFLTLPARPFRLAWKEWVFYIVLIAYLVASTVYLVRSFFYHAWRHPSIVELIILLLLVLSAYFLSRHSYLLKLLLLAVPVKLSLLLTRFTPVESFTEIHSTLIQKLLGREEKLQILDVSTGTCNSLYRHGWMRLKADYTGIDLSERMLLQGREFMASKQVPMDFVLGDACRLPFQSETFDVVLNYGAVNAYADTRLALEEMARVAKRGGLVLFLDEQLYESASYIERIYFESVLANHDVINNCPVGLIPNSMEDIKVYQVYQFYYICTGLKK